MPRFSTPDRTHEGQPWLNPHSHKELRLRGRLHHLISVAKSFEIALTLLLSHTPFDLAARYDVAEGVARPHDVMAQPPKLSFFKRKYLENALSETRGTNTIRLSARNSTDPEI